MIIYGDECNSVAIEKALIDDSVGRKSFLLEFMRLLKAMPKGAIELNAPWGAGKTYFVKQAQILLEGNSSIANRYYSKDCSLNVKKFFDKNVSLKDIVPNDTVVVYYDAWKNDNHVDPLLSIIYQIYIDIGNRYEELDFKKCTATLGKFVNVIGNFGEAFASMGPIGLAFKPLEAVKKLNNAIHSAERLEDINEIKETVKRITEQENVQEYINSYLKCITSNSERKLVVFVDELDRCKPDYAVRLLERVKHYFDLDNVIFVFSTNDDQLKHTIKKFYGEGFDAYRYLERFFDYKVELLDVKTDRYFDSLEIKNLPSAVVYTAKASIKICKLSFREINRYVTLLKVALNEATSLKVMKMVNKSEEFITSYDMAFEFFIPLLLAAKLVDKDMYNDLLSDDSKYNVYLKNYYLELPKNADSLYWKMFDDNYNFYADNDSTSVSVGMFIEFYREFLASDKLKRPKHIHDHIIIQHDMKEDVMEVLSMLSKFNKYE